MGPSLRLAQDTQANSVIGEQGRSGYKITGGPSSKYEHWRASALLRNIQNIRICMGKKPIVSLTFERFTENRSHKNP